MRRLFKADRRLLWYAGEPVRLSANACRSLKVAVKTDLSKNDRKTLTSRRYARAVLYGLPWSHMLMIDSSDRIGGLLSFCLGFEFGFSPALAIVASA